MGIWTQESLGLLALVAAEQKTFNIYKFKYNKE